MLSRFYLIPERHGQTDGQTDRRTDRIAISILRVNVLTRDKTDILGLSNEVSVTRMRVVYVLF